MRTLLGLSAVVLAFAIGTGCNSDDSSEGQGDQEQLGSSSGGEASTSSSSSSGAGASSSSSSGGSSGAAVTESCTATFVWLQKDAYKETGGRTTDMWPPHTTTSLEIACDGSVLSAAFMANHGSEPGSKDAAGNPLLEETRRLQIPGSRTQLAQLLDTYKSCECEPASFLSMDSLDQDLVSDLLGRFTELIEGDTVSCPDGSKADLVTALQAQDFESALVIVPTCTWPGPDGTPAASLSEALSAAIAATGSGNALDDYHVCNNDAKLQADLVAGFASNGAITACPRNADTCKGPMWLYNPNAP